MNRPDFERLLDRTVEQLGKEVRLNNKYHDPLVFQDRVKQVLTDVAKNEKLEVNPTFHPHAFPDIRANGFGVEAKSVKTDSWLSVGNSIFEGMRDKDVKDIYVVFAKLGGTPAVKWGRYEDHITHVRISHAPRFVLELDSESAHYDKPLFEKMGVSYEVFSKLSADEKMRHVRDYSRGRLRTGEHLWWLEDENSPGIEIEVQSYISLPQAKKIQIRAEATLLFPRVCSGSRDRGKYRDVPFFILKYHNVYCHQARDLFSAGSVAGKERGGNYLLRSLTNNQDAIRRAASDLPDALFVEYWGQSVAPEDRIHMWLAMADGYAKGWKPSAHLFLEEGSV